MGEHSVVVRQQDTDVENVVINQSFGFSRVLFRLKVIIASVFLWK